MIKINQYKRSITRRIKWIVFLISSLKGDSKWLEYSMITNFRRIQKSMTMRWTTKGILNYLRTHYLDNFVMTDHLLLFRGKIQILCPMSEDQKTNATTLFLWILLQIRDSRTSISKNPADLMKKTFKGSNMRISLTKSIR
jgi:hypothetical protein